VASRSREIDTVAERQRAREPGRGRDADSPAQIPSRGWRDIAVRLYKALGRDNVGLVAAGIAQYSLLAIFPGIAALVSIYALFASPSDVAQHMASIDAIMPPAAAEILTGQLSSLASSSSGALELGAIGGLLLALWSARRAMAALMVGTNIAYGERESRSLVRKALVSVALTVFAIIGVIIVVALGVITPIALRVLPTGQWLDMTVGALRWVVLWLFAVLTLSVVYRFAPDRKDARWRWVTWGSALAATLWLIASLLFTVYVANFGNYGETYGALGGVIILLLWLWLSAAITILGAEINAEMEHQTARDTTTGVPKPIGHRGAYMADTVGAAAGSHPK